MKLAEVIAISGQSGLYKFVAQSKVGYIVESLVDSRRFPVSSTAKVSTLSDISIFTIEEDMPLGEVFQTIFDKNSGAAVENCKKLSSDELKSTLKSFLPSYDEDRVHVSDMKKLFNWYNLLVAAGMSEFVDAPEAAAAENQEVAAEGAEQAAEAAKPKKKAAPKKKTTTPKATAAPKAAAASKSKATSKVRTIKAS